MMLKSLKTLFNRYHKLSRLDKFILKGAAFVLLYLALRYLLIYSGLARPLMLQVRLILIDLQVFLSSGLLGLFYDDLVVNGHVIRVAESGGIRVILACVGLGLMGWYAGLMLIYPGNSKSKLVYIPFGIILIFLLNTIRIALLVTVSYYHHEKVRFFDLFVFKLFLYLIVFGIWIYWIRHWGEKDQALKR